MNVAFHIATGKNGKVNGPGCANDAQATSCGSVLKDPCCRRTSALFLTDPGSPCRRGTLMVRTVGARGLELLLGTCRPVIF